MPSSLPSTPFEVLDISSRRLKFTMYWEVFKARLMGYWKVPMAGAATTFEEMTLRDIFYWVYKTRYPILEMEKGITLATDSRVVGLPQGFEARQRVTLGAGGDLLRTKGMDGQSQDVLFEKVADLLFDQDISFANLESPITTQPLQEEVISDRAAPIECCSPEQSAVLTRHTGKSFTLLHTANNHSLDMGMEGITTTHEILGRQGILPLGTHSTPESYGKGVVITKQGIKLGFISTTFGLNGKVPPEEAPWCVHTSRLCSTVVEPELALLQEQLEHCRAEGCDVIIASIHWGYEFEFFPRAMQVETAHALVEMGVDVILGHHPHVVQPVEYYRTQRDPGRIAVIAYSLGSMNWGFYHPYLVLSAILNLTFAKGEYNGREVTYVEQAAVTPVFRQAEIRGDSVVTWLEKLEDQRSRQVRAVRYYADRVLGRTAQLSQS